MYQLKMRKYVIINSSDVSSIIFGQVLETSASTLRYSVNGSQTFVKFEGETPSFLEGKNQYSHDEILTILATDSWTDPSGLG
tara:strand:+ start:2300 stop:2545 length:246 start_codon:yes stop_codon:yes gene_type:complete